MAGETVEVISETRDLKLRPTIRLPSGERLACFEAGSGSDVLVIHGAALTSHDMRASLLEPLAERFHAVAIDRPGHGRSTRPPLGGSLRRMAGIVAEGIVGLGLSRPIVIGHSIGGALAMEIALDHPELVSGVVAISPIVFPEPRLEQAIFGPRALLRLAGLKPRMPFELDGAALPLLWRSIFLPQSPTVRFETEMAFGEVRTDEGMAAVGEDALALGFDLARNAARYWTCRTPVEVLVGDADIVVNPRLHGETLAALLPDARLTRAPGLGHMLHHFAPDAVVERVERLAARGSGRAG
ncbi:alpha/beta hydrolase [Chelatococcus sambhunathii]|uniref:Alpha/beta hydrolase n=1 Tax=Chelatococcus sambhunathii TaxID=363953 RepID=A0ABU1DF96_9HYPH|nr:alpha/beta hydrolase [Chelatococcus sambhunathii]MDR4306780.1 alpha/beta hydrolase [Chelatococcus sambhunathii]